MFVGIPGVLLNFAGVVVSSKKSPEVVQGKVVVTVLSKNVVPGHRFFVNNKKEPYYLKINYIIIHTSLYYTEYPTAKSLGCMRSPYG